MNRKPYISPTKVTRPIKGFVCEEGHSWLQLCRQDGTVPCGHPLCVCDCETAIERFMTSDEINAKLSDLQWAAAVALAEIHNNW